MAGERIDIYVEGHDGISKPLAESNKSLDKMEEKANKANGALGRLGMGMGRIIEAATGFTAANFITRGLDMAIGAIGGTIEAASALNESLNKSSVVFGTAANDIKAFSETAATSVGLSQQAALEAAGTFGNLFSTMGMGKQPAAEMSTQLLKLSADLASFNNLSPDEVLLKLRSGLVGEVEPMRALGVLLNETTMKAKAMQMGIAGASGELTEAQKVQVRYALILEQTKLAQGDFARTSGDLANAQRIAKAELEDAQAKLGTAFLPIVLLATKAATGLATVIESWAFVFQRAMDAVGWLGNALRVLVGGVDEASIKLADSMVQATGSVGTAVTQMSNVVQGEMDTLLRKTGNSLDALSFKFVEAQAEREQSHRNALARIDEAEAKAASQYVEQITERRLAYEESLADMTKAHESALGKMDQDETEATADYKNRLTERQTAYDENLRNLTTGHQKSMDAIAKQESDATLAYRTSVDARTVKWNETMAGLRESHAATIDKLKGDIASLDATFAASVEERKKRNAEELADAANTFLARRRASKSLIEQIKTDLDAETAKGNERDTLLEASLRERLQEEERLQRMGYRDYLEMLKTRQAEETKATENKHKAELAKLTQRLADEEAEYTKRTAKLKSEYEADQANYSKTLADKQTDLKTRRQGEDTEFQARTTKLQAEYDKDLAAYQAALTERQVKLAAARLEENTEFEARTAKAQSEYEKDVANAAKALGEKSAESARRRLEEETAFITDMAKRRDRYDADVALVRAAEADKLKAVLERLAAEYAANVEAAKAIAKLMLPSARLAEILASGEPDTYISRGYQPPISHQAAGGTGVVTQPTLFLAGEAGKESYWFSGGNNQVPPPSSSIDYNQLAAVLQSQPIILRIDGEDLVVRGYDNARRRGRI